ncbi:hypothetical protein LCM20_13415 [Halobacillus litoralis]|uniref:hypothetical protein n=1 Tax=Halobacillus litoralis TaxID=45668 RepID=UPI001CD1AE0F|nr:hypothetical protein [Halobacillus litoralis]MCA0971600.1 hypothetical protein [Halobacillus litoralis]
MIFVYMIVAGVPGLMFLGPAGAVIGVLLGAIFGATQSNYRKIADLEKELEELKKEKA